MAVAVSNSIATPAVNGADGTLADEFINGLVQGSSWQFGVSPRVLTYAFSLYDVGVGNWTAAYQTAFAQALQSWSSVANLQFSESGSGTLLEQSTADIAVALGGIDLVGSGLAGFGIFPSTVFGDELLADAVITRIEYPRIEGDIILNDALGPLSLNPGSFHFEVMVHEIGHVLGLKHPEDDGANGKPTFVELGIGSADALRWTVMSNAESYAVSSSRHVATPMPADILAIQHIYGANNTYRTGNDHYSLATDFLIKTIWDAGGTDTFDASAIGAEGAIVDLRPGELSGSRTGFDANLGPYYTAIAYNVTIENAIGSAANDAITGNNANNPMLRGGAGADTILGGDGNDWIDGETGNDPFTGIAGNDNLNGEAGDDTILAGAGDDLLYGDSGTDFLVCEIGNDLAYGGSEWDAIDGRQGSDLLYGEGGDDIIFGDGYFYLFGFANDSLFGGDGDDIMMGEAGENSQSGSGDAIYGEAGNDLLDGGGGNDAIYGGDGNDVIDGDHGNDYIVGGQGAEIMLGSNAVAYGGPTQGSDLFVYQAMSDAGDSIYGLDTRAGDNDGIDLRPLFDALGYTGTTPRADGYLAVLQNGTNTDIHIDANGGVGGVTLTRMVTLVDTAASAITDSLFLFQ